MLGRQMSAGWWVTLIFLCHFDGARPFSLGPVRTPDAGTFWRVMAEHRVKSFYGSYRFSCDRKEDPDGALINHTTLAH